MQHPTLPAAAPAAHGPRRAMRAVHLEASDGEGALPAELRHRVDGEEYLGALSVVCVGEEHLVCVCVGVRWRAVHAAATWRVVWCVAWGAWQGATHACAPHACRVQGMGRGGARRVAP